MGAQRQYKKSLQRQGIAGVELARAITQWCQDIHDDRYDADTVRRRNLRHSRRHNKQLLNTTGYAAVFSSRARSGLTAARVTLQLTHDQITGADQIVPRCRKRNFALPRAVSMKSYMSTVWVRGRRNRKRYTQRIECWGGVITQQVAHFVLHTPTGRRTLTMKLPVTAKWVNNQGYSIEFVPLIKRYKHTSLRCVESAVIITGHIVQQLLDTEPRRRYAVLMQLVKNQREQARLARRDLAENKRIRRSARAKNIRLANASNTAITVRLKFTPYVVVFKKSAGKTLSQRTVRIPDEILSYRYVAKDVIPPEVVKALPGIMRAGGWSWG